LSEGKRPHKNLRKQAKTKANQDLLKNLGEFINVFTREAF